MSEKLKPCPFCGGNAEISEGQYDGKNISYVMCRECAARGEFFFVSPKYASNEKAIKAWNRRAGFNVTTWMPMTEQHKEGER